MNTGLTGANRENRGFTLLEVVLAIVIAIGILTTGLFFYRQAADLRAELTAEVDRLSAARLILDRMSTELRSARRHSFYEQPLIGESEFVQFIKTDVPSAGAWSGGTLGRVSAAQSDLKLVRYSMSSTILETTNASIGEITRNEEPLVESRTTVATNSGAAVLSRDFRFLRFRYWDGTAWKDSWDGAALPHGVEIILGTDVATNETGTIELGSDVFRRVVYLPGSSTETQKMILTPPGSESKSNTVAAVEERRGA